MILTALLLLPVLLYITRFPDLVPDAKSVVWLLWRLPSVLAVPLAKLYVQEGTHTAVDALCLPCHAHNRIKHAKHEITTSPRRTIYCGKCGLDQDKWPRYCANKVKQVNNKPPRRPRLQYKQVFWD